MRITSSGDYEFCRWQARETSTIPSANIADIDPLDYFQNHMSSVRQDLLNGQKNISCAACHQMEQHQKISGRQRQLHKTGILLDHFAPSFKSSTFYDEFAKSSQTHGNTNLNPVDWQIDLGNYCNSACIFCDPASSSRLAAEYVKLNIISKLPPAPWTNSPELIDRFVACLEKTPNLAYLHFLGGETLITPAFKIILSRLIECGVSQKVSIGFTTNLTVWNEEINDLLTQFKEVHLGMSIECLHVVNDYARWPSKLHIVQDCLDRWVTLGKHHNWFMTVRTTPTLLSIPHLLSVYDYAWETNISIESCNFLNEPAVLRMSVLPLHIRQMFAEKISNWISSRFISNNNSSIVNTRDPNLSRQSILQDAASYVHYLNHAPDESDLVPNLINFLKLIESNRGNSILDYLPEYEQFLRAAGY
jgi:hypothetical protein